MKKNIKALAIAKHLISIDTSSSTGIDKAITWLKLWSKEQSLFVTTFPNTKALLIETNHKASPHFSFVAHLDVVSAAGWKNAFKPSIKTNQLIGRGAIDDKGPLAVCLETLLTFKEDSRINVSCLIITDEETKNQEIGKIIKSKKYKPHFSLVVDGGTHQLIDVGQKGIIRCELSIKTSGGHSAFEESSQSASLRMLNIINELNKFALSLPHNDKFSTTFINISALVTETIPYGLPTTASTHLEIQFPLPQTSKLWLKKLKEFKEEEKNLSILIRWVSDPHLLRDNGMLKLFETVGLHAITTGGNNLAKDLCLSGTSSASHCPVNKYTAHCDGEKIGLDDLEKGVKIYKKIIESFIQQSRKTTNYFK